MNPPPAPAPARLAGFRAKLFAAILLVVTATTLLALYFAERSLAANVAENLEHEFDAELAARRHAQEVRSAALVERCRTLVRKPRIRAAFEDDALDLLSLKGKRLRIWVKDIPDLARARNAFDITAKFDGLFGEEPVAALIVVEIPAVAESRKSRAREKPAAAPPPSSA